MFNEMKTKDTKIFFTNKNSAEEMAFEIDNPEIFENCTCGEYFNYDGVKVFTERENYRSYKKLLACL